MLCERAPRTVFDPRRNSGGVGKGNERNAALHTLQITNCIDAEVRLVGVCRGIPQNSPAKGGKPIERVVLHFRGWICDTCLAHNLPATDGDPCTGKTKSCSSPAAPAR